MNSQNKGDNMAFNLSRQQTIEDDNQNNTCGCECCGNDESHPEVVATHGWVFKKLGEFKAMLCKFENILGTKLWNIKSLRADDVVSKHIMANKFILIDDDGNKMELKIKDGNVSVQPVVDETEDDGVQDDNIICDCGHNHCNSPIISDDMLDPGLFDDEPPTTICTCCKN